MRQSAAQERNRDRLKAALGVAAFHAVLGYALVTGLGYEVSRTVADSLKVFDVPDDVPPPAPIVPEEKPSKAPEGAASPENLKGKAAPVVAPTPKVQLKVPPPVRTAPIPGPLPGSDRTAGASDRPGPGTGAGGTGTGTGSGGSGSGSGGGGIAVRAERISGAILNDDYPRAAKRAGAEGTVRVVYTVDTDGRARDCRVTGSSGSAELDETTCRLVERRFRYRPARDGEGRPVPERVGKVYTWYLPFRRPPFDPGRNP